MSIPASSDTGGTFIGRNTGSAATLVKDHELTAARHYIFDGAADGLTCKISGEVLQQIGGAPTYGANFLQLAANRFLRTGLPDDASFTMAFVMEWTPNSFAEIARSSTFTNHVKGFKFTGGGGATNEFLIDVVIDNGGLSTPRFNANIPLTINAAEIVFAAITIDLPGGAGNARRAMIGNRGAAEMLAEAGSMVTDPAGFLQLGGSTTKIYEWIVWNSAIPLVDLGATGKLRSVYRRRKAILKKRSGLVVV
jgi:hypothetical protein